MQQPVGLGAQRHVALPRLEAVDGGILEQGGELARGRGGLVGVKAVVLGDLLGGDGGEVRIGRQVGRLVEHVGDERVDDHGGLVGDKRADGRQDDQVGRIDVLLLLLALGRFLRFLRFLRLLRFACRRCVCFAGAGLAGVLLALACTFACLLAAFFSAARRRFSSAAAFLAAFSASFLRLPTYFSARPMM